MFVWSLLGRLAVLSLFVVLVAPTHTHRMPTMRHHRWCSNCSEGYVYGPWRTRIVRTTAYVVRKGNPCDPATNLTATGTIPHRGTAAVDPHTFPFATEFRVSGYGFAIARDTGSLVKRYHIDLAMTKCADALRWGNRPLRVSYRLPLEAVPLRNAVTRRHAAYHPHVAAGTPT